MCDRLVGAGAAVERLADPADDEDVVVHREPEQDHEQQQRHHRVDPRGGAEAEQALAEAVLEDEHEHAVRGGHRQQVEQDRLDRDHERAERDQHQCEREQEHEGDDDRRLRLQLVGLVLPLRRQAGDARLRVREGADRLRDDHVAQLRERCVRGGVGSLPLDRDGDVRDGGVLVDRDGDRLVHPAAGERPLLEPADRASHRRRVHVRRLDDDVRRERRARERLLHPVVRLDDGERLRERVRSRCGDVELERRRRERQHERAGGECRQHGPAQDAVDDRAPDPPFAVVASEPADERDAQPVDPVAEPREHGRQDRQRAEHGDGDHEDRRDAERGEGRVAGQEHAGHRHDHRQPGDEHRATRGGGGRCRVQPVPLRPAARSWRSRFR